MRHIFLFGGYQLKAFALSEGKITHCTIFTADADGLAGFTHYVCARVSRPVRFLVDILEEDFYLDSVPHVIGKDRKELQQRLLNKYQRGAEHRYIAMQGRQAGGRKDDEVLVAGISNSVLLKPWLNILHTSQIALAGIHSLPLYMENILKGGSMQHGTQLLISQQVPGSVRHSLYDNGRLKMSRLAHGQGGEHGSATAVHEIEKTIQFLENQRLLDTRQDLQLHILGQSAIEEVLQAQAQQQNKQSLLGKMQLHPLPEQKGYADRLLVEHLAAQRRPKNHYAHNKDLRIYHYKIAVFFLKLLVIFILFLTLCGSGYLVFIEYRQGQSIAELQAAAQDYRQHYDKRTGALSELQVEAVDIEYSVKTLQQLQQQYSQRPQNFMRALAQASQDFPGVSYRSIDWSVAEVPSLHFTDSLVAPFTASVGAVLLENTDSPRQALQQVNSLLIALRKQPGFTRVIAFQMPFDLASNSEFQMNGQESHKDSKQVMFSFRIEGILP